MIVDAYAVSQFGVGKRDRWTRHPPPTTELPLPELLNTYSGHTVRRCLRLDGNLTQDKILSMATFYLGVVEPIMASSARWALGNLAKEVQGDHQDCEQGIALTLPELVRLTRATYRFHLLGRFANTDDIPRGSYRMPSVDALFRLWEPWEVEEVFSFYKFAHDVYAKICKDISWDVHPDNPRFDDQQRPPTPRGAFEINMEYDGEFQYNRISRTH